MTSFLRALVGLEASVSWSDRLFLLCDIVQYLKTFFLLYRLHPFAFKRKPYCFGTRIFKFYLHPPPPGEVKMAAPRIGKLFSNKTAFFLCDMQENFRPSIRYFPEIIAVAKRMVDTAKIVGIPVVATEQYPKGLGSTVSEIDMSNIEAIPKTVFSMVIPEVEVKLRQMQDVKSIVLFGIEAHVCIQQTALELLERDYEVHIVADGVSSRSMTDRMFALERLRQSGAFITTSESVLFSLLGSSKHPNFKEVQALVKTSAPDSGLLSKV